MNLPPVGAAAPLTGSGRTLYIGAYGFEERSLGWGQLQAREGARVGVALLFKYVNPKGTNLVSELRTLLGDIGAPLLHEEPYNSEMPVDIEANAKKSIRLLAQGCDEVILDVSAMTKLLILVCLCCLRNFPGQVRIVYSEAKTYVPSERDFTANRDNLAKIAVAPSYGVGTVLRTSCLSSVAMQGQPVTLIAFTSFNEQLVRHILGTMSPHRLIFINGKPPRDDFAWREAATQYVCRRLISSYPVDNPIDSAGRLSRTVSTLHYAETLSCISELCAEYGTYERVMVVATGSKMQTIGLWFAKVRHPDIHIEYPTPDSYFFHTAEDRMHRTGVRQVHEIVLPRFAQTVASLSRISTPSSRVLARIADNV